MTVIDPTTEEPAREMLGHAIRGETDELAALIRSAGDERYRRVLGLCLSAAAYVAVDVAGRWPTAADVREIARLVSEQGTEVPLDQQDVYDYLSGAALGLKSLPAALGDDLAAARCRSSLLAPCSSHSGPRGRSGGTTSTRSGARTRRPKHWTCPYFRRCWCART
jgi:hypothetical protein